MTAIAPSEGVGVAGAAAIPAAAWDRLARRGFHRHGWFAAAEAAGWRGRHVVVGAAAAPSAVVPAFLVGEGTAHDLHDRWLGPLRGIAARAGLALRPVLSVQAPFAQCSEPLGDRDTLGGRVMESVFDALESEAERSGARAVVWPFVDADRAELVDAARRRGYGVCYAGVSARLEVAWTSFEDYIRSRSKSVRRTIRTELKAVEAGSIRLERLADFRAQAGAMDRLYREAFLQRNGRPAPGPADLLRRLADTPAEGRLAQLAWEGERLVGMSLNVWTAELLDGTFAALAPEHRGGPLYANDLCYEPLRLACREGIAAIDLGASALYAKVLRGAALRPRVALVRGVSPAWHRALCSLGRLAGRRTALKEQRALAPLGRGVPGAEALA